MVWEFSKTKNLVNALHNDPMDSGRECMEGLACAMKMKVPGTSTSPLSPHTGRKLASVSLAHKGRQVH